MSKSNGGKQGSFLSRLLGAQWRKGQIEPGSAEEQLLREKLAILRRRLRGAPMHHVKSTLPMRAKDRFARRKAREALKRYRNKPRRPIVSRELMVARYRKSPILDALVAGRETKWTPMLKRSQRKETIAYSVKNFSFVQNPHGVLQDLKQIGELEATAQHAALHFDDEFCLDAGSYLVLAEIWPQMARVFAGGRMGSPVQKVLSAIGVGQHNKMSLPAAAKEKFDCDPEFEDIWAFPLQRRRPANSSLSKHVHIEPQTREVVADRFCDTVNSWLGVPEIELELNQQGKAWLANLMGELLCNAERHSQPNSVDGEWSLTGFMVRRRENDEDVLRCYLAFLSVGRSIARSLDDASTEVKKFRDAYIAKHWACGRSADTLTTLVAMQDTITRDAAASAIDSGGTGLMDVLDFVCDLGMNAQAGREPCVTIVSGKSCIQLRPPYIRGERNGNHDPRLLWCNTANSHDDPPDPAFVYDLRDHFSGTLVSVAFTLDPAYLSGDSETEDGTDQP